MRQVIHVLLTRPPLSQSNSIRKLPSIASFDLHVLGTPPAFILSQDQTLMFKSWFQVSDYLAWLVIFNLHYLVLFWIFSNPKAQTRPSVFRIFRVLHTVQSSIIKVLGLLSVSAATLIVYHKHLLLSTTFLTFFLRCVPALWLSPQRKRYLTRCFDNCQHFSANFFNYFSCASFSL